MPKFSVKKPLTVFVAVVAVLVLGVVAYFRMTPDLLPNMDFPYVIIMTTYPGASPEKVETQITKPMEQAMSTLEHIKSVSSTSSENASLVMLEFEDSVNMDTIGVDIQQQITALSAGWEDTVGTPYVLKINPSMLPVAVAAVSMEGKDTIALTEFLNDTLMNQLEGVAGVARITTTGGIEQKIHVVLEQSKIDAVNRKIVAAINGELDDAKEELEEQKQELEGSKGQMNSAQSQLDDGAAALAQQTAEGQAQLDEKKEELNAMKQALSAEIAQLETVESQLKDGIDALQQVPQLRSAANEAKTKVDQIAQLIQNLEEEPSYETLKKAYDEANTLYTTAQITVSTAQADYEAKKALYDAAVIAPDGNTDLTALETDMKNALAAWEKAKTELSTAEQQFQSASQTLANRDALYTAIGLTPGTDLGTAQATAQASYQAAQAALTTLESQLGVSGASDAELSAKIQEYQGQLATTQAGLTKLYDTLAGIESGETQLKDAQAALDQAKTQGMLEISMAAGKLAAGSASIEMALGQIESGLETLEDSREDALRQTDLNRILTMDLVTQILTAQNFAMPAGYVEQDGINYMVSIGDEITDLDTLKNLLLLDLGIEGLEPIRLEDVAEVMLTDNRDETYARLNGRDAVMLSFEKQSTYSTAQTTNNLSQRFRELEEEYPGLEFVDLMNQGDYIYLIVNSILSSLLLGAVFAIIVLYLFLRDLRPTFITLCAIPISVIFAIVLMYFSGVTINMISLSGLAVAVGMLVDNSVVVIENIYRLRAKGANVIQAAVSGAAQVAGAVTASTLTTVCVFLPIVFVEGITRQLFTDLALTMTYSLMASLIVSLTLVPAMASGMLRKEKVTKPGILETKLLPAYTRTARWALSHKPVVFIGAAGLLVVTAAVSLARGFIFMPTMDMPNINVSITMPEETTREQAVELADTVLERISQVEGIQTAGAMMNTGLSLTGGSSQNSYDVTVYITLADESASGAAAGREIEALCADLPCTVTASSAMMDMSMLTGSGITMNLFAEDMEDLQNAARTAAQTLEGVEGLTEISDGLEDAAPALHISVDRNKAMEQGLTVAQIYMELASGLTADGTVASLELDGVSTEVIVEKPEGAVLDAQELRDYVFEVTDKEGEIQEVPLSDFAEVEETTSLTSIARSGQKRYLSVTAQVLPGYNVTLLADQVEQLMEQTDLGDGVSCTFSGENESILEAMEQLLLMLVLGIVLVYLVMVAQFQSLKSPFIVMFTIPLAFTGGFLALLICGMEVSVISLIGFVMLTGIIVNNGIVLVDYINQLRQEGMERREAIVEAGVTRMRPILMTTITTVLGLIDMAVRKSAGTSLMQPIAVVCIGGLVYATLMTLFVVPCIYDMVNKKELRSVREEDLKLLDL